MNSLLKRQYSTAATPCSRDESHLGPPKKRIKTVTADEHGRFPHQSVATNQWLGLTGEVAGGSGSSLDSLNCHTSKLNVRRQPKHNLAEAMVGGSESSLDLLNCHTSKLNVRRQPKYNLAEAMVGGSESSPESLHCRMSKLNVERALPSAPQVKYSMTSQPKNRLEDKEPTRKKPIAWESEGDSERALSDSSSIPKNRRDNTLLWDRNTRVPTRTSFVAKKMEEEEESEVVHSDTSSLIAINRRDNTMLWDRNTRVPTRTSFVARKMEEEEESEVVLSDTSSPIAINRRNNRVPWDRKTGISTRSSFVEKKKKKNLLDEESESALSNTSSNISNIRGPKYNTLPRDRYTGVPSRTNLVGKKNNQKEECNEGMFEKLWLDDPKNLLSPSEDENKSDNNQSCSSTFTTMSEEPQNKNKKKKNKKSSNPNDQQVPSALRCVDPKQNATLKKGPMWMETSSCSPSSSGGRLTPVISPQWLSKT